MLVINVSDKIDDGSTLVNQWPRCTDGNTTTTNSLTAAMFSICMQIISDEPEQCGMDTKCIFESMSTDLTSICGHHHLSKYCLFLFFNSHDIVLALLFVIY